MPGGTQKTNFIRGLSGGIVIHHCAQISEGGFGAGQDARLGLEPALDPEVVSLEGMRSTTVPTSPPDMSNAMAVTVSLDLQKLSSSQGPRVQVAAPIPPSIFS